MTPLLVTQQSKASEASEEAHWICNGQTKGLPSKSSRIQDPLASQVRVRLWTVNFRLESKDHSGVLKRNLMVGIKVRLLLVVILDLANYSDRLPLRPLLCACHIGLRAFRVCGCRVDNAHRSTFHLRTVKDAITFGFRHNGTTSTSF